MGKRRNQDIRSWLEENGYHDVAKLIEDALEQWEHDGVRTRRNWWDILCGDRDGKAKTFGGREFPVLRAAQNRQGRSVTANSLCRNPNEVPPKKWKTERWAKDK